MSIRVAWQDGTTDVVDLSPMILAYKVFRLLHKDPTLFRTVALGYLGGSITWGGDMDIGADTIERLAVAQRPMPPEAFRAFMERHRLTLDAVPTVLGISRRQAAYFAAGNKVIPRTVALACTGYDAVAKDE
jgi:hypothetical protein